jgi:hypothetical protein
MIKLRKGMWEAVAKRSHYPRQIFTFGTGSDEVMLRGEVEYVMKDGKEVTKEWAAKAVLEKGENGRVRMKYYQVYLGA